MKPTRRALVQILPAAAVLISMAARAGTATPIEHLLVIVGENETFDGLFATYVPRDGTVRNLLSEGIITPEGAPGPKFDLARQAFDYLNPNLPSCGTARCCALHARPAACRPTAPVLLAS